MPSAEEILTGLREIANDWRVLAVFWHLYFGVVAVILLAGFRPSKRVVGVLLGLPCLSVSALAWGTGNPFNGTVFALMGLVSIAVSLRFSPQAPVEIAPYHEMAPGVLLVIFGWVYPHFLDTGSPLHYLYSAPLGLIPCPTLSMVIGIAILLRGFGSRGWALIVGLTGIFYGLFGVLRLGVAIDGILLAGALLIVFSAFARRRTAEADVS